jgi:hypothetical protein
MITFEGPNVVLGISISALSAELQDLEKIGEMLPEGAVKDFRSEGGKCSFNVQGGVAIHLEKDLGNLPKDVILRLQTVVPTPVKFSLDVIASDHSDGCSCFVRSNADLNPFTRMMVEPALNSLFEKMAEGMEKKFPISP